MIPRPHVVLGGIAPDGTPPLPATIGESVIWSRCYPLAIGDCPAWEYRDGGDARFVTIQRVSMLPGDRAVWIAWVPSDDASGPAPLFQYLAPVLEATGVLAAWWPVDDDGGISAVDSPDVLAAWPSAWRVRLPGDAPGDPFAVPPVPAAPATGPRCIGAGLA